MSPEEKELLKRSIALAEENNGILRSIQRSMRLARLMTLLYWMVLIGATVGAYYYFQPYLEKIQSLYGGAQTSFGDLGNVLNNLKSIGR